MSNNYSGGSSDTLCFRSSEPDLGENQFLLHYSCELLVGDVTVGWLLYTRYNHKAMADRCVPRRFINRPGGYTNRFSSLMLEAGARYARLPGSISERLYDSHGSIIIIDEIILEPSHQSHRLIHKIADQIITLLSQDSDALLIPFYRAMARHLGGIDVSTDAFWESYGFDVIEGAAIHYPHCGFSNVCIKE